MDCTVQTSNTIQQSNLEAGVLCKMWDQNLSFNMGGKRKKRKKSHSTNVLYTITENCNYGFPANHNLATLINSSFTSILCGSKRTKFIKRTGLGEKNFNSCVCVINLSTTILYFSPFLHFASSPRFSNSSCFSHESYTWHWKPVEGKTC